MKVIEDYAQRRVDEKLNERNKEFVINLSNEGFAIDEIARISDVSVDFVEEILAL